MKYKYIDGEPLVVSDEGPWFDTTIEAMQHELAKVEEELKPWIKEASEAIRLGEPNRGGGILMSSRLLQKHSRLAGMIAGAKQIPV